jgi:hypothetical protein
MCSFHYCFHYSQQLGQWACILKCPCWKLMLYLSIKCKLINVFTKVKSITERVFGFDERINQVCKWAHRCPQSWTLRKQLKHFKQKINNKTLPWTQGNSVKENLVIQLGSAQGSPDYQVFSWWSQIAWSILCIVISIRSKITYGTNFWVCLPISF